MFNYSVDASFIRKKRFGAPEELVVASKNERTIFGNCGPLLGGKRHWGNPQIAAIRTAKVISLDTFFGRASLEAARAAKTYRITNVTVDGTCSDGVVRGAAVTVISEEFRRRKYRNAPDLSLFEKYIHRCSGLVVFTTGSGLIRYGREGNQTKTSRPPTIKPIDTSGAGDSFRAGMVYGVLKRWNDDKSVRFASALAAMNCLRFPGVLKSPSIKEIYSFIKRHHSAPQ